MKFCAPILLVCTLLVSDAWSQTDEEIRDARLRGIEFLKSQQKEDGRWEYEGHDVGITALCTLALFENGVPVSDPVIDNGLRYVRKNLDELTQTYDLTLAVLLMSRIGEREDRSRIRDLAARLICGQLTSGGWTYSCPKVSSLVLRNRDVRPKPKTGPGDNSCTQFAVLGLWVASRNGIDVDEPLRYVARRFTEYQNPDGGWSYRLPGREAAGPPEDGVRTATTEPSKDSMTFAGLFCLTVARASVLRKAQSGDESRKSGQLPQGEAATLMSDPVFSHGLERAGQFIQGGGAARYYLWSVERLGVLLGLEEFGGVDWFRKGAAVLLRTQRPDGSWPDAKGGLADTAFAILFLRKANLGSDISRLLEGEPEKKIVIVNRKEKPRFDTLDEAFAAAEAGDTIRIDGEGPYTLPNVAFDKNLTIQAGFGYAPVFRFGLRTDRLGIRLRPETNPEARSMIRVSGGELTLEGLRLEMDAPEGHRDIPWTAITVAGGNLRVLNCLISEGNRKGMAAIHLAQPGRVVVRNSVLSGGRAAIEIAAGAEQEVRIDNSVLFSKAAIRVIDGPEAAEQGTVSLELSNCTAQAPGVFAFSAPQATIDVVAENCIFQADWLGAPMLVATNDRRGRSFKGTGNLYNVSRWLGTGTGSPQANTRDLKSWTALWDAGEENSMERAVSFQARRSNSAFSHTVRAQDWDIPEDSSLAPYRGRLGVRSVIAGPLEAFDRYRESILYTEWTHGNLDALVTTAR